MREGKCINLVPISKNKRPVKSRLLTVFDHYYSKLTLLGNWKLLSENRSLKTYKTDDPSPEKWQVFEAMDDNSNVELVSTVPEAEDWNVKLFFRPSSKIVKGAKFEGGLFLRYMTEDVSHEEPLRIT